MALTLDDLFASPDHYLHSFDGPNALFVPMDRSAYQRSIFLDGRIQPPSNRSMNLPVAAMAGHAPAPAATGWVFHVAHCGSTLLARALDDAGSNLVLREPLALRQLALAPDGERLKIVLAMLSKRYRAELPTVVKANVPVNFLLPELAAREPEARVLLLYLELDDYLRAILRNEGHRDWLRKVTGALARHLPALDGKADAERAAALWTAQMRAFAAATAAWAGARSLDAEAFFAEPARYVAAAAEQLQVPMTSETAEAIVAGPLFATYSKNPAMAFDNDARLERRREIEASLAPEIEQAREWVEAHAADVAAVMERVRGARLAG
jgi:hypothetical protein